MKWIQFFLYRTVAGFLNEMTDQLAELSGQLGRIGGHASGIREQKYVDVHNRIRVLLSRFIMDNDLPFSATTWQVSFELPEKIKDSIIYQRVSHLSPFFYLFGYDIHWKTTDKRFRWGTWGRVDSAEVKVCDKLIESMEKTCRKSKKDILAMNLQNFFICVAYDEQTRRTQTAFRNFEEAEKKLKDAEAYHEKMLSARREIKDIMLSSGTYYLKSATDEG